MFALCVARSGTKRPGAQCQGMAVHYTTARLGAKDRRLPKVCHSPTHPLTNLLYFIGEFRFYKLGIYLCYSFKLLKFM